MGSEVSLVHLRINMNGSADDDDDDVGLNVLGCRVDINVSASFKCCLTLMSSDVGLTLTCQLPSSVA